MRNSYLVIIIFLFCFSLTTCQEIKTTNDVLTGAEVFLSDHEKLPKNKKLGIVTNHTAAVNNIHLIDTLNKIDGINITAIFSPEHGFTGTVADGIIINDSKKDSIKIYSLYGKTKKATTDMLHDVEILIFDIQSIGARFYTYNSTLYYMVEVAAKYNIPLIVLDRPNPIGMYGSSGNIIENKYFSFVGISELPIIHGLTIGEMSLYFNKYYFENKANVTVIKNANWNRSEINNKFKTDWLTPSPNIPDLETAIIYPGMCLIEGTNLSEGRGTKTPFKTIGSPFLNSKKVISEFYKLEYNSIELIPTTFTPAEIKGKAYNPKYENELCNGIQISVINENEFKPVEFGVKLIWAINKVHPKEFKFRDNWIDKLYGNSDLRKFIKENKSPQEIISLWEKELTEYELRANTIKLY